jgi:hypothetical protein
MDSKLILQAAQGRWKACCHFPGRRQFIRLCAEAKANGINEVVAAYPWVPSDNEEII